MHYVEVSNCSKNRSLKCPCFVYYNPSDQSLSTGPKQYIHTPDLLLEQKKNLITSLKRKAEDHQLSSIHAERHFHMVPCHGFDLSTVDCVVNSSWALFTESLTRTPAGRFQIANVDLEERSRSPTQGGGSPR